MKLRAASLLIGVLCLSSCGFLGLGRVDLPSTPLLTAGTGWGLVKSSYVRIKLTPSASAQDVAALRDGSLVRVLGREYAKDGGDLWYHVTTLPEGKAQVQKGDAAVDGWMPELELSLFGSRSQAERALRLRSGNQGQ